ncbi:MAG: alcohol dehydrogenase catalytic domain-containing protein [Vicinamibacteria bacterium]|nr:alcohol dehydrogenase catalytic domain-containing protein [Vicinamibacteria bacterium]
MRAAVLYGPGDVRVEEVGDLVPGPGEIVVRTLAAFTCGTDRKVVKRGYHAKMLKPPCVFGHEASGEVAAVGRGVTAFQPGDRVVAANSAPCGVCRQCARDRESLCEDLLFWNGTFADAYLVPARVVAKNVLPLGGVAPEDAAMAEPLACCVKGVQEAGVREGDRVLVIGAGPIGLMLVRLCALKSARVTAAARRPEALVAAKAHGAHEVVGIGSSKGGLVLGGMVEPGFDIIFDTGGAAETASLAIRAAGRGGVVNLFAGCPAGTRVEVDVTRVHYEEIRIHGTFHHTPAAFRESFRLIASGAVEPSKFVTSRKTLEELPESLIHPAVGVLKTLVMF